MKLMLTDTHVICFDFTKIERDNLETILSYHHFIFNFDYKRIIIPKPTYDLLFILSNNFNKLEVY